MNKKCILVYCMVLLTCALCGCRLAKDDGLDIQSDRLIGVYVTPEHLDLFDLDRYLNDNISSIMKNGGEIKVKNDEKYAGRIYAALKPMTLTHTETGETIEDWEYVFEEIGGVPFFMAEVKRPDGESYSRTSSGGSTISDAHISVGDETTLDGTIYITPKGPNSMYPNPVYQSSDGQVYLTAGTGVSFSGDVSEGETFTQTLDEKHTTTENGKKTETKFKVTVKVAIKYPPKSVSLIQMSAENIPVSRSEYKPDALPENVDISKDTAYVLVESKVDSPNGERISRELFDHGDEHFTGYMAREDGICEARTVALLWDK